MKSTFPLRKSPITTIEENGELSNTVFQHPKYPGVLSESRLILQFLSDTFSKGIWNISDPIDKRQDTFFQEFANGSLGVKLSFMLIFELIPAASPLGLRQLVSLVFKTIVYRWQQDLGPIFEPMKDTLSDDKPFFSGDKFGLADVKMSRGVDVASQRGYLGSAKHAKVIDGHRKMVERPAYKRALANGPAYNLKTFM